MEFMRTFYSEDTLKNFDDPTTVRDVTWMSDHSVHLAKWMPALEQVTPMHLGTCPQSVPNLYFFLKPLA